MSSYFQVTLLHHDKTDHEETCEYRPYSCPCPGASCKWQGGLEQVMLHLMTAHKSITTLQGIVERMIFQDERDSVNLFLIHQLVAGGGREEEEEEKIRISVWFYISTYHTYCTIFNALNHQEVGM